MLALKDIQEPRGIEMSINQPTPRSAKKAAESRIKAINYRAIRKNDLDPLSLFVNEQAILRDENLEVTLGIIADLELQELINEGEDTSVVKKNWNPPKRTDQGGRKVTKAVVPAAGLGTRFLPATKSMPKEMLPVVDKPAIHYVVEEASKAGLTDILIITGRNKNSITDYFDSIPELESTLEAKGDQRKLSKVQEPTELARIHSVRQGKPLGLGHAVSIAELHTNGDPFAVLLGDDIIDGRDELLTEMARVHEETGGTVVALMEVPKESIHLYGCAAVDEPGYESSSESNVVRITDLVEKPNSDEAPSNLAVIGRYVLTPGIYPVLERTAPGKGNEIQLTDALRTIARGEGPVGEQPVYGVVFKGRRYDTGDKADWIKANVLLGVDHHEIGEEMRSWIVDYAEKLKSE